MKRILIVRLSALGDVVHAIPVAAALKAHDPNVEIDWVVEPPAYDIVAMASCVDNIIVFEKKKFKSISGFLANFGTFREQIQKKNYDLVLDLQGLFKSAAIAYLAKAPKKLGTGRMREGSDRISTPVRGANANGHIVERHLDVVRSLGIEVACAAFPFEITEREEELTRRIFTQAGANMANRYAAFTIGGTWANKRWKAEYFAVLSDWLYHQNIIPVLLGGGAVDQQLAGEICAKTEIPPLNLIGKTNLRQLAAVLKGAAFVLGSDTGAVHLAAGLGTPTIMLMGATNPERNGPYGQLEHVIEIPRSCKGCWKRACPKKLDCLGAIAPEVVMEKCKAILQRNA